MNYELLMKKCINLAKNAYGKVSPNPLVGCVIVDDFGNIISEGYHKCYGQNHAERDALLKLNGDTAKNSTLIVNLEPCSHYGKTPPCADLIISKGIKRVVIGMQDVNPIVSGNGIKKLKAAGIEVIEGILEQECKELNEIFIKNMVEKKTFVAIKTATTLDGKVATFNGKSKWITSDKAREEVRKIRNMYDAILTSSSTIIADNPSMVHKNKVFIDRTLKTNFNEYKIYSQGNIHVFYEENLDSERVESALNEIKNKNNIFLHPTKTNGDKIDFKNVLDKLYEIGIMSVLVEAGGHINGSMLEFTDKIYQFIAPKILGDNTGLSCYDYRTVDNIGLAETFKIKSVENFDPDILITLKK